MGSDGLESVLATSGFSLGLVESILFKILPGRTFAMIQS